MFFPWTACLPLVVSLISIISQSSALDISYNERSKSGDIYNYTSGEKIQGVALGGWLVLEPYITPTLFNNSLKKGEGDSKIPVDEFHYCKKLGKKEAKIRLEEHWRTWINESDFATIASYGLNMVRIPIGYWAFEQLDEDPYVYGQEDYLDKAIEWSRNHGLKVWIDLHGAPGSQNGFDNSGLSNRIDWQKKEENINMTLSVLNYISTKYGGKEYLDVITGIEILNEPLGPRLSMKKLHDFYKDAYYTLRETTDNNLVYHDAFQAVGYWDYRLNGHIVAANNTYSDLVNLSASVANSNYERVVIDYHHYEVFGVGELKDNIAEHLSSVKGYGHAVAGTRHPAVIGEWSAALTDCAPWLNGVRRGARYDATYLNDEFIGSCEGISDFSTWNSSFKESVGKFIEAQLDAYNMISGWVFWCYKTENAIEWDLSKLIEHDLFPQPLDKRVYTSLSVSLHQRFSRSTMILQLLLVLTAVCVLQ